MIKNKKSLATFGAIVLTGMISTHAMAANTSICQDPLQRVCAETKDLRSSRDVEVNKLKTIISEEANRNAAPRIAEMKKRISGFHPFKRLIEAYKIRNQEIMRSAKVRVGDLEKVITSKENVDKLKSYMYQAIEETQFDKVSKAKFKEIISSVVIGNFGDYLEKTGLEDNVLAQLMGNACGSDGLVDNAFATTLNNQRYVLVCPGFLITLNNQATDQERFDSILQAIAHEMGHHIDNGKVGNALYAPYLSCLANNHISRFNKTSDDKKFCKANEKEPAKCNEAVVLSHAGELIADQWGIKVTEIHARKAKYSVSDSEVMLTNSWAKLCGSGDEGIHPTGDFRIGTLMRTNPGIENALGCGQSEVVGCTFDGEVK